MITISLNEENLAWIVVTIAVSLMFLFPVVLIWMMLLLLLYIYIWGGGCSITVCNYVPSWIHKFTAWNALGRYTIFFCSGYGESYMWVFFPFVCGITSCSFALMDDTKARRKCGFLVVMYIREFSFGETHVWVFVCSLFFGGGGGWYVGVDLRQIRCDVKD